MRQIIAKAVAPESVIDVFAAAGLEKPDISILSDEFPAELLARLLLGSLICPMASE